MVYEKSTYRSNCVVKFIATLHEIRNVDDFKSLKGQIDISNRSIGQISW